MTKTINRQPFSVSETSKVDHNFFNHSEWKGIIKNKNFLQVDQQSFDSSKNVYVDTSNLLRSRPAVKSTTNTNQYHKMWSFGDILVLLFNSTMTIMRNSTVLMTTTLPTPSPHLVFADRKIFIFMNSRIDYYDTAAKKYVQNADNEVLYIPETKIIIDGVEEDGESPNEFTTSYYIRYLFNNALSAVTYLLNSTVIIKIDDTEYTITVDENSRYIIVNRLTKLNSTAFSSKLFAADTVARPLLTVSENGSMIINLANDLEITSTLYSADGKTFTDVSTPGLIGPAVISTNGFFVIGLKSDGIYVKSLVKTEELAEGVVTELYPVWTNIYSIDRQPASNAALLSAIYAHDYSHWCCIYASSEYDYTIINKTEDNVSEIVKTIQWVSTNELGSKSVNINNGQCELAIDTISVFANMSSEISSEFGLNTMCNLRVYLSVNNSSIISGSATLEIFGGDTMYGWIDDDASTEASVVIRFDDTTVLNISDIYIEQITSSIATLRCSLRLTMHETALHEISSECKPICRVDNSGNCIVCIDKTVNNIHYGRVYAIHNSDAYYTNDTSSIDRYRSCNAAVYVDGTTAALVYQTDTARNSIQILDIAAADDSKTTIAAELVKDAIFVINTPNNILTNTCICTNRTDITKLLIEGVPVAMINSAIYVAKNMDLYISAQSEVSLKKFVQGESKVFIPDHSAELYEYYFSKDNILYISQYSNTDTFKWYFPKINTESFDADITNLHPISTTEVAIFFRDFIYYVSKTDNGYAYYRSKIGLGCIDGSEVITTFDSKNVIFSTVRGLVAMSYQDFISSTEQSITYLSDNIYTLYETFFDKPVKLYQYKYYILCYSVNTPTLLLLDIRNLSWWMWEYSQGFKQVVTHNNETLILSNNKLNRLDYSDEQYRDDIGKIDWSFTSQKLHLNAPNYDKRIVQLILSSVQSNVCNAKMTVKNYRKKLDSGKEELLEYDVDVIRSYVKRVNYSKVSEFQYTLSADLENAIQVPLSISNITIKYIVTGVIR